MSTSSKSNAKSDVSLKEQEVSLFVKNVWFFTFFFAMLLMIASFGLIAEV